MIDPEFKAKWLEALRSGRYPQTREKLRDKVGFCCLGVACDISGKGTWKASLSSKGQQVFVISPYSSSKTCIPSPLREEIGLTEAEHKSLANLNDIRKATFSAIAVWIERNL